ncbi:MAG: patatin-like phospholipase family protein [Phycisphaeraceae bacterium]|nr:MAG: patatin-like phospholipase family protein [Phycisphaeraceae bacterium]
MALQPSKVPGCVKLWLRIRRRYDGLADTAWRLRFQWLAALVFAGVTILPDQSIDYLASLLGPGTQRVGAHVAAAALLSWTLFQTSRETLRIFQIIDRLPFKKVRWVPSFMALLPWLALLTALTRAEFWLEHSPIQKVLIVLLYWVFVPAVAYGGHRIWIRRRASRPSPPAKALASPKAKVVKLASRVMQHQPVDAESQMKLAATVLVVTGVLFAGLLIPPFIAFFGPIAVVGILLSFWTLVLSFAAAVLPKFGVPVITFLLAAWFVANTFDLNDNHYPRTYPSKAPPPPDAADAFDAWITPRLSAWDAAITATGHTPPAQYPIYLAAAEGGGIRNAYWTGLVLARLHHATKGRFSERLFAVSGVSGGSIGAAVYAAAVRAAEDDPTPGGGVFAPPDQPGGLEWTITRALSRDLLSPTLARGLSLDAIQQFLPVTFPLYSRARALEQALDWAWEGRGANPLTRGFLDVRGVNPMTRVPFLLLNTTHVATGQRIILGHLRPSGDAWMVHSTTTEAPDTQPPLLRCREDLSLTAAAFLSARFPIVTPAGSFLDENGGKHRLADGGYFENSGAATLADLLRTLASVGVREPRPAWADRVRFTVVLIDHDDPAEHHAHGFGDPMSPLRTMLATRGARGREAVDDLSRLLADLHARGLPFDPAPLRFACQDAPGILGTGRLPLGWFLSTSARDTLNRQLDPRRGFMSAHPDTLRALERVGVPVPRPLTPPAQPAPTPPPSGPGPAPDQSSAR